MSSGRVDNLAVVMGLHPDYLSCFGVCTTSCCTQMGPGQLLAPLHCHHGCRPPSVFLLGGSHMAEFCRRVVTLSGYLVSIVP